MGLISTVLYCYHKSSNTVQSGKQKLWYFNWTKFHTENKLQNVQKEKSKVSQRLESAVSHWDPGLPSRRERLSSTAQSLPSGGAGTLLQLLFGSTAEAALQESMAHSSVVSAGILGPKAPGLCHWNRWSQGTQPGLVKYLQLLRLHYTP